MRARRMVRSSVTSKSETAVMVSDLGCGSNGRTVNSLPYLEMAFGKCRESVFQFPSSLSSTVAWHSQNSSKLLLEACCGCLLPSLKFSARVCCSFWTSARNRLDILARCFNSWLYFPHRLPGLSGTHLSSLDALHGSGHFVDGSRENCVRAHLSSPRDWLSGSGMNKGSLRLLLSFPHLVYSLHPVPALHAYCRKEIYHKGSHQGLCGRQQVPHSSASYLDRNDQGICPHASWNTR